MTDTTQPRSSCRDDPPALIDDEGVAREIRASTKTVRRLSAHGLMPAPIRVGTRLVRWRRAEIEQWIADGCPPVGEEVAGAS